VQASLSVNLTWAIPGLLNSPTPTPTTFHNIHYAPTTTPLPLSPNPISPLHPSLPLRCEEHEKYPPTSNPPLNAPPKPPFYRPRLPRSPLISSRSPTPPRSLTSHEHSSPPSQHTPFVIPPPQPFPPLLHTSTTPPPSHQPPQATPLPIYPPPLLITPAHGTAPPLDHPHPFPFSPLLPPDPPAHSPTPEKGPK